MKEIMDKVFENLRNMSQEEFQATMTKAEDSEIYKALEELDEFYNYFFEQEELK